MKNRAVPIAASAFFLAMTIAVTYPGYVPFNRVRPFVLGMPLSLVWQLLWVGAAVLVLTGVYLWERRRRSSDPARRRPDNGSRPEGP